MARYDKPKWQAYKQMLDKVSTDEDEAFSVADALLKQERNAKPDGRSKKKDGLSRRFPGYGLAHMPPLEGCTNKMSDTIREIVALRYSGYTDAFIQRQMDKCHNYIHSLEVKHPKQFQLAEAELLKNCRMAYERNLTVCRAALSDVGMEAVRTLRKVMEDVEAKPQTRLRAAETVLKLMIGSTPQEKSVAQGVVINMGDVAQKYEQHVRQSQSYIHDIQDAEVVEEEKESVGQASLTA